MFLRLSKEVEAVVNGYPYDGDMAKKPNSVLLQLGRERVIVKRGQTELRLGIVKIPVPLDESNGSGIFWIYALSNMTVCAIEITKLEVNVKLVTLQPRCSHFFSENKGFVMKYEADQSSMNLPSFIVSIII